MSQGRLKERVVLITGAARGIGKATAFKMANEGASVVLIDILSEELSKVVDELNEVEKRALGVTADIGDKAEVTKIVQRTVEHFGTVDILVNNAGINSPAPLEDVTEKDWDMILTVNLKGTFFCAQTVVPIMKKKRYGKIVNIGSRAILGKCDRTAYGASKAGVIGMTRTWALELAPYNINVNAISPGPIATDLFKSVHPEGSETTRTIVNNIPLKRMGTPEDLANLISFLGSDEASFITGQTIFICGGITVGMAPY